MLIDIRFFYCEMKIRHDYWLNWFNVRLCIVFTSDTFENDVYMCTWFMFGFGYVCVVGLVWFMQPLKETLSTFFNACDAQKPLFNLSVSMKIAWNTEYRSNVYAFEIWNRQPREPSRFDSIRCVKYFWTIWMAYTSIRHWINLNSQQWIIESIMSGDW